MFKQRRYQAFHLITWIFLITGSPYAFGQDAGPVHWLTFEQLEDSLKVKPKKVSIDFHADWCGYCHQMDREAFQDGQIAELLNNDYYAVRMDVETADTIRFGNQVFINERIKKRNPVHQIALLMASRKGKPFSLPAMVFLDEKFEATARYFQYLDAQRMSNPNFVRTQCLSNCPVKKLIDRP